MRLACRCELEYGYDAVGLRLVLAEPGRAFDDDVVDALALVARQFVGDDGHNVLTHVTRDDSTPARTVTIKSGAAGALQLRWSDVPSGTAPCMG